MMYRRLITLALLLPLLLLAGPRAAGEDTLPLDELERAAGEYAPKGSIADGMDLDRGLLDLVETGTAELKGVIRPAVKSGVLLLVIVMLCGVAQSASDEGSRVFQAAPVAGALTVTAVAAADVRALIGLGKEAIHAMSTFSQTLLPTMAAAVAAAGAPAAGAAKHLATVLFSDLLIQLISRFFIPLTYAYLAASAVFAALGNRGLQRIARAIRSAVTGTLTAVLVAFVGYLTVSGVISGASDAVTVKTAKLAMSSMIPVVGGVLSDAAETVLVGAGMLKNAVGIFGVLAILGICLIPFMELGVHYLVYKLSAALSATMGDSPLVDLIDNIGGAFGLVLGMTASCAMILLLSVISGLSATGVLG